MSKSSATWRRARLSSSADRTTCVGIAGTALLRRPYNKAPDLRRSLPMSIVTRAVEQLGGRIDAPHLFERDHGVIAAGGEPQWRTGETQQRLDRRTDGAIHARIERDEVLAFRTHYPEAGLSRCWIDQSDQARDLEIAIDRFVARRKRTGWTLSHIPRLADLVRRPVDLDAEGCDLAHPWAEPAGSHDGCYHATHRMPT